MGNAPNTIRPFTMKTTNCGIELIICILDVDQILILKGKFRAVVTHWQQKRYWKNDEHCETAPSQAMMIGQSTDAIYDVFIIGGSPHPDECVWFDILDAGLIRKRLIFTGNNHFFVTDRAKCHICRVFSIPFQRLSIYGAGAETTTKRARCQK